MQIYSYDEVLKESLQYFKGDDLAATTWINKYALKNEKGELLEKTPNDMHKRIAKELSRIENNYPNPLPEEDIYNLLKDFRYIVPQGSPMFGIGNDYALTSISNCFIVGSNDESDSYGSIMRTDEELAQIYKMRGGCGTDISHYRPSGTLANGAILGEEAGATLYMERFSNTTREVQQGGKRRGALLISIDIKHPDAEKFIDKKTQEGKVTGANVSVKNSDEFMRAVITDEDFIQTFPVDLDINKHTAFTESLFNNEIEYDKLYDLSYKEDNEYKGCYAKRIKARRLWNKIIHNSWNSAEPGCLFIDTIKRESPADCYFEDGFETKTTNPCVTGDTKVLVADGRCEVDFKTLAQEGSDVLVYSFDENNKVQINKMRNPRLTKKNAKIFKIKLDSGDEIKATENHRFYLKNGKVVELKDLKKGDSLRIVSRVKEQRKSNDNYILHGFGWAEKEHRFLARNLIKDLDEGLTVHHKDHNPFNNSLDNLEVLTIHEHNEKHNRVFDGCGEKNIKYSGLTNQEVYDLAKKITLSIGRRISRREYLKNGGIAISSFRKELGKNCTEFLTTVANDLFDDKNLVNYDTRLIQSYINAKNQGYNVKIEKGVVLVEKICEFCGDKFFVDFQKREISFCSQRCALNHTNKNMRGKNIHNTRETYKRRATKRKEEEVKIYSDLKFELQREPKQYEFIERCQVNGFYPFRSKFSYQNMNEIKKDAEFYNHKVVSVEFCGYEDVYNGTVDNDHNYFIGGFKSKTRAGFEKLTYCLSANCGEIPLCPYDSCRLMLKNLYSYVIDPFTSNARFNWELFKYNVRVAQRLMDDVVDLELEKIDKIISKVKDNNDPEDIKRVELNLWTKIKEKAINGRRTGLGITAEGDMLAALGLTYGTKEATNFATEVHKTMAVESYRSSIEMAKERGAFPIWDFEKEKGNPFINRVIWNESIFPVFKNHHIGGDYSKYGRRNIANLTIAPAGSVSLLTQTTSGIEPVFLPVYKRRRKTDDPKKSVFKDETGDMWEEFNVFHHKFVEWFKIAIWNDLRYQSDIFANLGATPLECLQNCTEEQINKFLKQSPYYKATSADVDYNEKVRMQGEIQKWIDHSISVTVNMPENVTEETVSDVYMNAYKSGCKGVTVYREGSRSGVLISNKKKEEKDKTKFEYTRSIERGKILECDIYHKTALKKEWMVLVGKKDGNPYEIFALEDLDNHVFPKRIKVGTIEKIRPKCYKLTGYDNEKEYVVKNIVKSMSPDERTDTRKYSSMLRHGMHPKYVRKQISEFATITSFDKVVERVLANYVDEEDLKEKCPECGTELIMQDGCKKCFCGYSACS